MSSYIIDILYCHTVKLKLSNGEQGSGLLYFPKEPYKFAYILTAKHCLYGKENKVKEKDNFIEIEYLAGSIYKKYKFKNKFDKIISTDDEKDCGIFVILKKRLNPLILKQNQPLKGIGLEHLEINDTCFFRSFPSARMKEKNKSELFTSLLNDFDSNKKLRFKLEIKNYDTNMAHAKDLIKGCSGSGVFVKKNGEALIVGIIQSYLENIPKFIGYGLEEYNKILGENNLKLIPIQSNLQIRNVKRKIEILEVFNRSSIDPEDCQLSIKILNADLKRCLLSNHHTVLNVTSIQSKVKQVIDKIEKYSIICMTKSGKNDFRRKKIYKDLVEIYTQFLF